MGWVAGEFSRHRPAQSGQVSDLAQQQRLNNSWLELRDGLQADVNEYNRWGGAAVFEAFEGQEVRCLKHIAWDLKLETLKLVLNRDQHYSYSHQRGSCPALPPHFFPE